MCALSFLKADMQACIGPFLVDGTDRGGRGTSGCSVVCVHDTVPSWRFRAIGASWPHVQIVAPCDLRLVTKPTDARRDASVRWARP